MAGYQGKVKPQSMLVDEVKLHPTLKFTTFDPFANTTWLNDLQLPERNLSIYDPVWSIWDDMFKSGVLYTVPKVWRFMRDPYLRKKEEE